MAAKRTATAATTAAAASIVSGQLQIGGAIIKQEPLDGTSLKTPKRARKPSTPSSNQTVAAMVQAKRAEAMATQSAPGTQGMYQL